MSLLELRNIGKIYVSSQNVAVGIRGVNLSFDKGEFVAITGKSGSGKSTLLNVISGMDTYEEGELLIDGNPTAHYIQSDWEEYREKYISFIFQDYNIIDNFTVLQNVELALMNTYDPIERRKKALELLHRVGLSKAIHQKGSKLSGGQKQRTVIARALAKDSPIILADEPTGNLDSETSKEIIDLLYEVSKNKLVIIVTHNYEQVEMYATRHIRVYDGAIESDQEMASPSIVDEEPKQEKKESKLRGLLNGITLGRVMFFSKPKLTIFLSILLLVGVFNFFFSFSSSGNAFDIFKEETMFTPVDGRVVIVKQDGTVLSDEELNQIKTQTGAEKVIHFDAMFDMPLSVYGLSLYPTTDEDFGKVEGSYPKERDEVLLYVPISIKEEYDNLIGTSIGIDNVYYKIVGIKYFYDNTKKAKILFTNDGFTILNYASYFRTKARVRVIAKDGAASQTYTGTLYPSLSIEKDKIYVGCDEYGKFVYSLHPNAEVSVKINVSYTSYEDELSVNKSKELAFNNDNLIRSFDYEDKDAYNYDTASVYVSFDLLEETMNTMMDEMYRQASLLYDSNAKAKRAIRQISSDKYIAVMANTPVSNNSLDVILATVLSLFALIGLGISVIFLSFFINLCTNKSILALKPDFSIMRSMGIKVKTIKGAMYIRMILSLIPGYIILAIVATIIYMLPSTNGLLTFAHFGTYLFIFIITSLVAMNVARKQIKKLFSESVKTSLRGGAE